jgi:hypothetical protein
MRRRPPPALLEDDPAQGTYWGPPDPETGRQLRWSRQWFRVALEPLAVAPLLLCRSVAPLRETRRP